MVTVKASLVHRTVIFEQWQRIARAEKGHSREFRELVIAVLFEEDPLCLGGGGGARRHQLSREHYRQNFIGFKINLS